MATPTLLGTLVLTIASSGDAVGESARQPELLRLERRANEFTASAQEAVSLSTACGSSRPNPSKSRRTSS